MRVIVFVRVALCFVILTSDDQIHGQSGSFEVASIKENRSSPPVWNAFIENNRLRITAISSSELIRFAYELHADQVLGKKAWMESIRFDIEAAASAKLPAMLPTGLPVEVAEMLRALLRERFRLILQHDRREIQLYALVPGEGLDKVWGKRIRPSNLDCTARDSRATTPECWARSGANRTQIRGRSIETLVDYVEGWVKRPVLNETHIGGNIDVDLDWELTIDRDRSVAARIRAVEDQLGLKLISRRAAMPVVIIDRMERPSPN